ncbi:MAG TPA: hypothetical protein EYP40_09060 [Chromatiales bacterium]|nr:hypothetical protein [Chromatiales bacterium]
MSSLDQYPLSELKLIYQLLHARLPENPLLMDSRLLQDLQSWLQQCATKDGVDVSLHHEWARWLAGNPQ